MTPRAPKPLGGPSRGLRVASVASVASVLAIVAPLGCSLVTSFDGLSSGGGGGGGGDGTATSSSTRASSHSSTQSSTITASAAGGGEGGAGGKGEGGAGGKGGGAPHVCVDGQLYCGGDRVGGASDTLYRCSDGMGVDGTKCTQGCYLGDGSADEQDSCGCVPGGFYCGGDKVRGDAGTLYKCVSGTTGIVHEVCVLGCKTNPGVDDACK